ncbi:DUF1853 family protein [Lutimonas saemankumensis]|uniref:DUF1853 family protein n=1 Tax=Lutimonas saemankumensis TaxID=483016 RepID=UPI001CD1BAE4|nr:DUF1853 family protein [Lutimonas saemankumensis]MCA0931864.1 DUF1853 family protein [Lutimonas saemankumensis]
MSSDLKNANLLFQGYVNTGLLWNHDSVFGLRQFGPKTNLNSINSEFLSTNLRLGKLVERFVIHTLQQNENIEIFKENIQVKKGKVTIGELDCLLKQNETPIHLEVIYKFYLYDPHYGKSELDHWIGPNRNDSLIQKLNKLRDKQLPLLFKPDALPVLNKLGIDRKKLEQRVHFKAQLFLPLDLSSDQIEILNKSCLSGNYIPFADIDHFKNCEFYIPSKLGWLMEIQNDVEWLSFPEFRKDVSRFMVQKRSPLCWVKYPDGKMQKLFVVWWN